jgi:cytoskeleton protein RodZ
MTSIGETLRRARQKRNLDLARIAGELKIPKRFLDAMERDDFDKLPGGVFTKSFLRQYASFLGLDPDELVAEVPGAASPEADTTQLSNTSKPDVPGIQVRLGDGGWHSVRERRVSLPSWVRAGVLLVVLTVICSGVYYWWWQRPRHQVLAHETQPPVKTMPLAQSTPLRRPVANPSPPPMQPLDPPSGQEPASTPVPAAATTAAPPNPNASVRIGITAEDVVWVQAEVNGKTEFAVTLQPHEVRNIDADGEVILRLGNAGGASITFNGQPIPAVGPKGQIRTIQFTSGGFQIVSPPPKALEDRF